MNELARIAYEYENWQKGYLHESGESISIVQAQILKDVWISITQAELSHKTDSRDYKGIDQKVLSYLLRCYFNLLKQIKHHIQKS